MASTKPLSVPRMSLTSQDDCTFVNLKLPPGGHVEMRGAFHENLVITGFTGAVWQTRQGGKTRVETPGFVVVREAEHAFDAKTLEVNAQHGSVCREIHVPKAKLTALIEQGDDGVSTRDFSEALITDHRVYDLLVETHCSHERNDCSLKRSTHLAALTFSVARAINGRSSTLACGSDRRRYCRTIEYMRANYHRSITLQELADIAGANPFVLLRRFRQEFGLTPHEYLRMYRVNRARDFIRQGMKLADVALLCGFSDQSHLNRQFKKTVGVTPGQFIADRLGTR